MEKNEKQYRNSTITYWADENDLELTTTKLICLLGLVEMGVACYVTCQLEGLNKKGEPMRWHFQTTVQWTKKVTLTTMQKLLGIDMKVLCMRGSIDQSADYCRSEGKYTEKPRIQGPWEEGTRRYERARMDLEAFKNDMKAGLKKKDLWEIHPDIMVKYRGVYERYHEDQWDEDEKDDNIPMKVTVFWGSTGCGKSKSAKKWCNENKGFWRSAQEKVWWSGYKGQKHVVIDEFDPEQVPYNMLKQWTDRYPCIISGKCMKAAPCLAEEMIITCQHHPELWYKNMKEEDLEALMRRFDEVREFKKKPGVKRPQWNNTIQFD